MNVNKVKLTLLGFVSCAAFIATASPFPMLPGQFLNYETDFDSNYDASQWDLSAGSFVSHAQSSGFRPPTGSTVSLGTLQFGANGSAVLDITPAGVLGSSLSIGSDNFAVYGRITLDGSPINFAFGNAESMAASPDPSEVVIGAGYARNNLAAGGIKADFNNPADGSPSFSSGPPIPWATETADFAVHFAGSTIFVYGKATSSTDWLSQGSIDISSVDDFASSALVLYTPGDGTVTLSDLAISSIPEPGTLALLLIGGYFLAVRRLRK